VKLFGGGDVLLMVNDAARPTVGSLNIEVAMRGARRGRLFRLLLHWEASAASTFTSIRRPGKCCCSGTRETGLAWQRLTEF
jgi:hypothetical protein